MLLERLEYVLYGLKSTLKNPERDLGDTDVDTRCTSGIDGSVTSIKYDPRTDGVYLTVYVPVVQDLLALYNGSPNIVGPK
mmetsp:Transcript_29974/g.60235  ORF Transcript_29974/g.60235 Transcript_29974/m.60235 type:complete len:80 (-) Transcript_29974:407-646(-)